MIAENTGYGERANVGESAELLERAATAECTESSERAVHEECADWVERAAALESAVCLERASPNESTVPTERAGTQESTDDGKRAAVAESAGLCERLVARLNRSRHNENAPRVGSTEGAETGTIGADGYATEQPDGLILHSRCPASTELCHDNPDIRPQSTRGAAPSGADPALDRAAAAAWVPNSIGRMDGAFPAHQRRRGRAAHAPGAGRGGNSNRDAGRLARSADLRRGCGEG